MTKTLLLIMVLFAGSGSLCRSANITKKAFEDICQSAQIGDAVAQNKLGACFEKGDMVPKNYDKAFYWYRKSAEQGNSLGQYNLGRCYNFGYGVEKDLKEAAYWYQKSAEQGDPYAQNSIGCCYHKGEGVSKNLTKALYWYRKAAEQDNYYAQYNIGRCYENGEGVAKDTDMAMNWYQKAAAQGHSGAKKNLAVLKSRSEVYTKGSKYQLQGCDYFVEDVRVANNGLRWYLVRPWIGGAERGVIMENKMIVPCKYTLVNYISADFSDKGCFKTSYELGKDWHHGIYSLDGKCIIPTDHYPRVWNIERFRDKNGRILTAVKTHGVLDAFDEYYLDVNWNRCVCVEKQCKQKISDNKGDIRYYVVKDGDCYGIMDAHENFVVKPNKYVYLEPLQIDNKVYYICKEKHEMGLLNEKGMLIIPMEFENLSYIGGSFLRCKLNNSWGVITLEGKNVISTSRGYTSIGKYSTIQKRIPYTMPGYKGECNSLGQQITKIKVENQKRNTPVISSSSSQSSSISGKNPNKSSKNNSSTIVIEHRRDPIPVQEWVICMNCWGSKTLGCTGCGGSGTKYIGDNLRICGHCNGKGEKVCYMCGGRGGHYETRYQ